MESEDLDLFSVESLEGMLVQQMLVDKYGFVPTVIAENTLIGFIQGVKIDVIYHPFPWLKAAIEEDGIRILRLPFGGTVATCPTPSRASYRATIASIPPQA